LNKVRCVRIIEYIGDPIWLKGQLTDLWFEVGEPQNVEGGIIKEVNRFIEEYKEETTKELDEDPL